MATYPIRKMDPTGHNTEVEINKPVNNKRKKSKGNFAENHSNKVMGLVYIGAAILIIVVGLRGLGSIVGDLSVIPRFLIDAKSHKIHSNYVLFALFLEFFMLLLLALVTYITPQEKTKEEIEKPSINSSQSLIEFRTELAKLKQMTDEEMNKMRSYIEEFEVMSVKINKIQQYHVEAVKKMSSTLST